MDQLGQPLAHPRDRRTMQEDPQAPGRHPQNHPTRPLHARLEAFNNRIKVTVRMAYGFHRVTNLIALVMPRCGGLDIRLPQPVI